MIARIGIERQPPGGAHVLRDAQRALDSYFPRSDCLSWLLIDWLPDDLGDEIGRFVVYQMVPESRVLPDTRMALYGPDPLTLPRLERRPGITHRKWQLWREHHAEARLFWILQGGGGGHRYRILRPVERKMRRMAGLPPDTPPPGALPFAPPDWRLFDNLLDLDQVRQYVEVAHYADRNADKMDAAERTAAEDGRRAVIKWWARQVDEMVDSAGMVGRGGWWARNRSHFPQAPAGAMADAEIQEEQFVTDSAVSS